MTDTEKIDGHDVHERDGVKYYFDDLGHKITLAAEDCEPDKQVPLFVDNFKPSKND